MRLPPEILRAEILDWWEAEQERISQTLPKRLPALYYLVDQKIGEMPLKAFLRRGRFHADEIEPIIASWMEDLYQELTHEIDESFRSSANVVEGNRKYESWSYGDLASAGAALAFSAAPVAGIPVYFMAGGLTATGTTVLGMTFGAGALVPLGVAALAGSAVLLAAGPAARGKAIERLRASVRTATRDAIDKRVLGDPSDPSAPSLKGKLLGDLYGVAVKRIEVVK